MAPDAAKDSPEYKALLEQNRKLARENGTLAANERRRREADAAAEAQRSADQAAAEAQRQQEQLAEVTATLGPEGIALWNEIAADQARGDLTGAARKLRDLGLRMAQSQPAPTPTPKAGQVPPTVTGGQMNRQTPPPPPSRGAGEVPLGQQVVGEDTEALAAAAEARYQAIVDRNQNPSTRNRVTMRDRAEGIMNYLGAGYIRGGARPK